MKARANTIQKSRSKKKVGARALAKTAHASRYLTGVTVKVSPNLHWVFPFLRKAQQKMPNLRLPKYIRSYRPSHTRVMRVLGNAYFQSKVVVLATHTQTTYLDKKGRLKIGKVVRLPKSKILDTLAHEIAHLKYDDHGYEHDEYTRIIFKTFGLKERCPHCRGSGKIDTEPKP